jgi:cytochrome c biogenesis protein CcmG, thiol:disulfide interchange protein DsbE
MKLRFVVPVLVFGVLIATFALMLRRTGQGEYDPKVIQSPLLGKSAPAFTLPRVEDPNLTVSTADYRGTMYVLNVWGTWCVGCRQEHATLLEIAKQGLVPIVGLDTKDELADSQRWLSKLGNPYAATALDTDGRAAIDWGVYGAPETFLVDANGTIIHKYIGPLSLTAWQQQFVPLIERAQLEQAKRGAKVGS